MRQPFGILIGMALVAAISAQNAVCQNSGSAQSDGSKTKGVKMKVDYFLSQVDTDKDSRVSNLEWEEAGLRDHVFITLDADKSDHITKSELEGTDFPSGWDANKDGVLTLENIKAYDKIVDSRNSKKTNTDGSVKH